MKVNLMEFKNLQAAWEGINEYLCCNESEIITKGGGNHGPEMLSYNNLISIKRAWVDPNFDFGKTLGYGMKKWSSLINNYVDFNFLEMIKTEIQLREKKKSKNYNLAYHFANHHGSGKDCLISMTFSRRTYTDRPVVSFNIRTSEVTRRLIFDVLLIQRMVEYVYGHNKVEVEMHIPSMYITAESFSLYDNHKSIRGLLKPYKGKYGKFQKRILETLKEFSTIDPNTVAYKTNQRSVLQLQRDENGEPVSGVKSLLARELLLIQKPEIEFPPEVISPSDRRKYKRSLKNSSK